MKIRGTQASSWQSLAIFLREFNQAGDRLPLTNVTLSSPSPASPSSTVKPKNQRVNTGLPPHKLQLQEGKQSRRSRGSSPDFSSALQNTIFIWKLQCRTFHFHDILFSGIRQSSSIICQPANGIPQLPLMERRIKTTKRLALAWCCREKKPEKIYMWTLKVQKLLNAEVIHLELLYQNVTQLITIPQ